MREYVFLSGAIGVFTIAILCVGDRKWTTSLDTSNWQDENIQDLQAVSQTLKYLKELAPWPVVAYRRRLVEDNWSQEAREMKQEISNFFEARAPVRTSKVAQPGTLRVKKGSRSLDEGLPPISSNCTNPTSTKLPCPLEDLPQVCDKYNNGNFEECFQRCKKSICCTHDSKSKISESCVDKEDNCRHYIPCYIVWWKLSDTVGPAPFLRLPNSKRFTNFFNIDVDYIFADKQEESANRGTFYTEFFNHYTDDDVGLDDEIFEVQENWGLVRDGNTPKEP